MKIKDIIINEYGNTRKLIEINGNEEVVEVFNYNISNDIDYCNISLCKLATEEEIITAFN